MALLTQLWRWSANVTAGLILQIVWVSKSFRGDIVNPIGVQKCVQLTALTLSWLI